MGITTAGFYRTIVFSYFYIVLHVYLYTSSHLLKKKTMKQDIKNILSEKVSVIWQWWCKKKGNKRFSGDTMIIPIFSTVSNVITIMLLNIGIIIVSPLNLLLHHHCLQILYNTNFLRENVFYILCLYKL